MKVSLLEAAVNTNPISTTTVDDLSVVEGKALLSEVGVSGTIADVADAPASDQISVYVVHKGDTLASVAKMYDVSPNTIKWANDIKGAIKEGDVLTILPISGIKYTVKKGDTIASIAKKYKADANEIQQFNDSASDGSLIVGDVIIIPDAEVAAPVATPAKKSAGKTKVIPGSGGPSYAGYYTRPVVGGLRTQGLHGHNGVDLASYEGSNILAAAAGTVIIAKDSGWNGGYGNYIVVSHSNGTQTLYAHLRDLSASVGDVVSRGEVIAHMGHTGHVIGNPGTHLHFEVRGAVNPF